MNRTVFVAFDDSRPTKRFARLNRSLIDADATFPRGLTKTPEALLIVVLEAQRLWG